MAFFCRAEPGQELRPGSPAVAATGRSPLQRREAARRETDKKQTEKKSPSTTLKRFNYFPLKKKKARKREAEISSSHFTAHTVMLKRI